ncbi:hypothetical protein H310_06292 [Aphanomyces invadans]|uniref:RING-type domain-containing protein n=1 Tax=Aphanomyces invadans TaxID=157072 RepID=A0A024U5H8_9STRA|nr:hypothetical protein H310_06292 [Aphanomyces invadans]ETW01671.1 hypothetical protein H310_06292 [Aphanomyces invadans]|eukprot:XP_008869519.1 hypothetical protein H310_06292 [Aphanomyces invadans]
MNRNIFDALAITLTKANVTQGHRSALYTMAIVNKETQAKVTTAKTDGDFATLTTQICIALEHGHTCDALCPWFYVDVQQKIPKKHWFRSSTHARVVASHLKQYQDMMNLVVAFVTSPHNRSCYRAIERVPDVLHEFLFTNLTVDPNMYTAAPLKQPRLSCSSNSSRSSDGMVFTCSLCDHVADDCCGLTKLQCGHTFHDDCILEALNARLACPDCLANASIA